jgi:hypothetical protein
LDSSLENLSAWIGLYDSQAENFASQVAYAPMNILQPGSTMPLMAYFAGPLPVEFSARSEVLSASTIPTDDSRYLNVKIESDAVDISPDGNQALVSGDVILPEGSSAPSMVWVLVVAYDRNGQILGARKWKSDDNPHFDVTVYSLGGLIDHIDALGEARP